MRDSIYLFDSKTRKLINTIDKMFADGIKFISPHVLFIYKNYDSHPKDDPIKSKLALYNIKDKKLAAYITPDFKYIGYTILVHNFIDASNENVAFAQTIPYNIRFYSTKNLDFLSEINDMLSNDNNTIHAIDSFQNISNKDLNAKALFLNLKKEDSIIRIEKVVFLNDHTLLISKTVPKQGLNKRLLDVWKFNEKENKWIPIIKNQLYITEKDNDNYTITPDALPFDLTFSAKIITDNSIIYQSDSYIPPPMGINNTDYKKYKDDYYANHNLNYFLWVYSWEIR